MSSLRSPANDRQSVEPFERIIAPAKRALKRAYAAKVDRDAQEAIEGGAAEPTEVPGAQH